MILRALPHSPYVRKVRVFALENGQDAALEVVETHVFDPETPLLAENPLGKVPTLVLDDGTTIYDSTVICEYLDSLPGGSHDGAPLIPRAGMARIDCLRRNALADGLGQAATWNIRERYRPEDERSGDYMAYYERAIGRSLAALEAEAADWPADRFDLGDISTACALSYLDLRYPDRAWQNRYPTLGAWQARANLRPSMAATPLGPYSGPMQPQG